MTFQLPPSTFASDPFSMPLLAVACPACHGALAVTADLAGHAARCPLCASGFFVPLRAPLPDAAPISAAAVVPGDPAGSASPGGSFGDLPVALQSPPAAPQPRSELEFSEPVKMVASGGTLIELHRLTPREKSARRARRNLIMLVLGVSILMAIVLIFGTKPGKRP
jgi:hypothetical protein